MTKWEQKVKVTIAIAAGILGLAGLTISGNTLIDVMSGREIDLVAPGFIGIVLAGIWWSYAFNETNQTLLRTLCIILGAIVFGVIIPPGLFLF